MSDEEKDTPPCKLENKGQGYVWCSVCKIMGKKKDVIQNCPDRTGMDSLEILEHIMSGGI